MENMIDELGGTLITIILVGAGIAAFAFVLSMFGA